MHRLFTVSALGVTLFLSVVLGMAERGSAGKAAFAEAPHIEQGTEHL